MCTDQEALCTKKEGKHSNDGIGKVELYAWLRRAVRSYTRNKKEKLYRLNGTRKCQRSKCTKVRTKKKKL